MSKILEMPKSKTQLWSDLFQGRKLAFSEGADALQGWLAEWAEKRQASQHFDSDTGCRRPLGGVGDLSRQIDQGKDAAEPALVRVSGQHEIQEAYPGDPGPEPLAEAVTKEDL